METDLKFDEEHVQLLSKYFCETVSNGQARDALRLKLANHRAKLKKKGW